MNQFDIALNGPAVTVCIRVGQLELLQRAASFATRAGQAEFCRSPEEQEALVSLIECIQETRDKPDDWRDGERVIHGYAL